MDITYESTVAFEKDLASFQTEERTRTIDKINRYCSLLLDDRAGFFKHATRPAIPVLRSKLQSSLYSIRVSQDIRVLATIDDDPLFDQVIVTLLRAVRRKDIDNVFKGLAESLYQSDLASFREQEGRHNG